MGKIHTLGAEDDSRPPHDHDNDSDSDEGRQGFFVGGSEHSGQQVLGPNDADRNRRVQQLFDAVRNAGAEQMSQEDAEKIRASATSSSSASYQGGAYRLGDPTNQPAAAAQPTARATGPIPVHVILWQDGFSIDDGPLRSFEDPASRSFLMSIQKGQVPPELQAQHRGREIDMHLERRMTPYVPPKVKPFATQGHRLGSLVPDVVTIDDESGPSGIPKLDPKEAKSFLEKAQQEVGLDESKPKGQIQIRQTNGERLIGEFNSTNTVEDVRSFIVTAIPDYSFQPFTLHTTYPKKKIEDETQTVSDAGIFKAVVVMVPE